MHNAMMLERLLGPGNFSNIATRSGVCRSHVSRVLRGKRNASSGVIEKIAVAAGCSTFIVHAFIAVKREIL